MSMLHSQCCGITKQAVKDGGDRAAAFQCKLERTERDFESRMLREISTCVLL